jgi:hypothetical protein
VSAAPVQPAPTPRFKQPAISSRPPFHLLQTAVVTTTPATPLAEAGAAMRLHAIGGMPVVDEQYRVSQRLGFMYKTYQFLSCNQAKLIWVGGSQLWGRGVGRGGGEGACGAPASTNLPGWMTTAECVCNCV